MFRSVGVAAMVMPMLASTVHAQLAASVSVTSDYRYRGASIGSDQPALTLNLSYDAPVNGGADGYVGGAATVGRLSDAGLQLFSQSEYVGMAGQVGRDSTWDVGASNTFLSFYDGQVSHEFDPELYAGLKTKIFSYYIRYSPHYFRDDVGAFYAEVDASVRPGERWRLFAHVGALTPFAHGVLYYPQREQYDARIGVAALFKGAELGVAWVFQRPGYGSLAPSGIKPDALVVTATCFF